VDPHQRKKIERKLQVFARDPEIASMGKKIFGCSASSVLPVENSTTEGQKARDGRVLDFVAFALALGTWWYTVVNPAPSFWFGSFLLLGACFFAVLAMWGYFSWKRSGRIASAICFLLLFSAMDYSWYRQLKAVAATALEKALELDRKEAFQSLTAHMEYEIGDDPILAAFAYSNGSSHRILIDTIESYPYALFFGGEKYDVASFAKNHFIMKKNAQQLEAGGDGQTDPFLQSFFAPVGPITVKDLDIGGKRPPVSCADLLIWVNYRLESQPNNTQQKQFRFVTASSSKGSKWVKEGLESKTTYCTVRSPQQTK